MALPTYAPLSEIFKDARLRWTRTKVTAQNIRNMSASGDIRAGVVLNMLDSFRNDIAYFQGIATTPGLGPYVQTQYDDPSMDIAADFNAMVAALQNVVTWVVNALPRAPADGQGNQYVLLQTVAPDGARVDRTFTPTQTAGMRTALDALIATIG